MSQLITLDVIDRPRGGAAAATVRLHRLRRPGGCLALIPCATGDFSETLVPKYTPRRIALLAAWTDPDAAERAGREGPLAALRAGAREAWHVRAQVTRARTTAPWRGWLPDAGDGRPADDDEPLLVLISGELRARFLPPFLRGAAASVRHANAQPGYLGGLGLNSSVLNTTSCSAWRTAADSRRFAFASGAHATAMRIDRAGEHHRTERFIRLRPLASSGTLRGRDPFAGVL
jgi:hypothetical protein